MVERIGVELFNPGLSHNREEDNLDLKTLYELEYVDCVVKEILRVAPPVGGGYRKALETFEVNVSIIKETLSKCSS